jgi:hypothetical protein
MRTAIIPNTSGNKTLFLRVAFLFISFSLNYDFPAAFSQKSLAHQAKIYDHLVKYSLLSAPIPGDGLT